MDLGVASVPERVEATGPGCDRSAHCEGDECRERNGEYSDNKDSEECLELLGGQMRPNDLDKGDELEKTKDAWGRGVHVSLEPNEIRL
jgi:hypothetical protein